MTTDEIGEEVFLPGVGAGCLERVPAEAQEGGREEGLGLLGQVMPDGELVVAAHPGGIEEFRPEVIRRIAAEHRHDREVASGEGPGEHHRLELDRVLVLVVPLAGERVEVGSGVSHASCGDAAK